MSALGSQGSVSRVRAAYARIREADRPEVWISVRPEPEVLAEAEQIDERVAAGERLPLAGLVFAVKDNIDVLGLPTTAGCAAYSYPPTQDATCVARLRAAGAIAIGKTNLDQFATGLVGTRSPFGPVRNAWDPARISGGSSSGSAVAVALSEVDFALGTDTAGSGRVPAALQGIVGVKPTVGSVPTSGVVPACRSLDCVTVFAPELALARAVAETMADPAPLPLASSTSSTSRVSPALLASPVLPALPALPARPRVAVPVAAQLTDLAEGWSEAFAAAVARLRSCGVEIVEVDISPLLEAATLLYGGAFVAERYAAVGAFIEKHPDADLDPTVAAIVLAGAAPTAADLFRDRERLERLGAEGLGVFDTCDALLTPTTTGHPTLAEVAADPVGVNSRLGRYTNFANLFGLAALAVPSGLVDGLPFGVMLTGAPHSDTALAGLAARFAAPPVQVAVFGAHLRGQPLNRQLVGLGGTFAEDVRTAPEYRLFALRTVPTKPGLVRIGAGASSSASSSASTSASTGPGTAQGASIAGELWSLPAAGFAELVATLPPPMAIGPVALADGRTVPGFLCEPAALDDAEDITPTGGWRVHLAEGRE
ncbi:allophanate hydrolase [Catenulispora sp. EB89]|uniref:allophanate hydrolase n=1 Tax=Catenulispora sp. EB89 TaxID=3156257 RepID=UPI0035194B37